MKPTGIQVFPWPPVLGRVRPNTEPKCPVCGKEFVWIQSADSRCKAGGVGGGYSTTASSLPFSIFRIITSLWPRSLQRADSKSLIFSYTPCNTGNTWAKMVALAHSFLASIFYYSPMRIISLETSIWGKKKSRSSFSDEMLVQSWQTLSIAFATT